MFDTVEQANMRLNETVVMFDGEPCTANHFEARNAANNGPDNITCTVTFLSGNRERLNNIRLSDRRWGFQNLRTGYTNYRGHALWTSRVPRTTTRWGLDLRTLRTHAVGEHVRAINATRAMVVPLLTNQYPTWTEALRQLRDEGVQSVAVSRHFALYRDRFGMIFLYYKTLRVAYSEDDAASFRLTPLYNYLRQQIETEVPTVRFNNRDAA